MAHETETSTDSSKPQPNNEPLYFEEMEIGQTWRSPARTITETDVVNFAGMTGDYDPLHVDHEFASGTPFRRPIAHGLLGLSLVAGLSSHSPWPQTRALLVIRNWEFKKPIFFGDTVHVVNEIIDKCPKGCRNGQIVWRRQLVNQNDEVVQEGVFETLVASRVADRRKFRNAA